MFSSVALAFGVTVSCTPTFSQTDPVAEFYKGKTVSLNVGFDAGGGYDTSARVFQRHFGKHIPGNPTVIVTNMAGAGSMRLLNHIYNAAPKDGTAIGLFSATMILEPMLGNKNAQFDPSKFGWIGNIHSDINSCGIWKGAGAGLKTFDDILKSKTTVIFGAISPENVTARYPIFLKKAFNAPFQIVSGYKGTNTINIAMQKGEVHASCGMYESTVLSTFKHDYDSGDLNIVFQAAFEQKAPTFKDARSIGELIAGKGEDMRQIAELVFRPSEITRPLVTPPEIPPERIAALRAAFEATMKDPGMIADGKRMSIDFKPMTGDQVAKIFASFFQTPKPVVDRAQELSSEVQK